MGVAILAAAARVAGAQSCESLATFHVTCGSCHEAECSGRLTFDDPLRASAHVQRYAGPLDAAGVAALVELLRVTKQECRVDDAAAARCGKPPWDAARLRRVHVGAANAWFVPIGAAPGGPSRLVLRFDRDVTAHVRLTTARFEVLHEAEGRTQARALEIPFAPPGEALFLRVEAGADAELLEVRLARAAPAP